MEILQCILPHIVLLRTLKYSQLQNLNTQGVVAWNYRLLMLGDFIFPASGADSDKALEFLASTIIPQVIYGLMCIEGHTSDFIFALD